MKATTDNLAKIGRRCRTNESMVFAGGKTIGLHRALLEGSIVGERPFEADVGETFCSTVRRRGGRRLPAGS